MSLCERPGCSQPGAAAYGMVAEELTFWIDHLNDAVFAGVLCGKHADSLSVPRGWTLIDRRDPDLHLFSLRSSTTVEPTARSARPSAYPPDPQPSDRGVEQLQIDCGFDSHPGADPIETPTEQVPAPPEPTSVVAAPVVGPSAEVEELVAVEVLAVDAEPPTVDAEPSGVSPIPTEVSAPTGNDQPQSRPRQEPAATHRPVVATAATGADQLALALDPALTAHSDPADTDRLNVAPAIRVEVVEPPTVVVEPVALGAASDLPPPIVAVTDLAHVDRPNNDELPVPHELQWLDRHDGDDSVLAPPTDRAERSQPTRQRNDESGFADEIGVADPTPWMPTFDHNDDLDGMLDATSPLLRRAFHGDDIS